MVRIMRRPKDAQMENFLYPVATFRWICGSAYAKL
jgi:hypothetical protein